MPTALEDLLAETPEESDVDVLEETEVEDDQLAVLQAENQKMAKRYKDLQSKMTKLTQGRGSDESNDEEDDDDEEVSAKDRAYLERLGVPTREEMAELKSQIAAKNSQEEVDDLRFELNQLVSENPFVKPRELLEYMNEEAENGRNLTVDQAARLKYFDQFAIIKTRGRRALPISDTETMNGTPLPEPRKTSFKDQAGLHAAMLEELEAID